MLCLRKRSNQKVCDFHASEEGFEELEKQVLKDFFGNDPYYEGDYSEA